MKLEKKDVVIGVLVAVLVYDGIASRRNHHRFKVNAEKYNKLRDRHNDVVEVANLYARRLNEEGIKFEGFDFIVMHGLLS